MKISEVIPTLLQYHLVKRNDIFIIIFIIIIITVTIIIIIIGWRIEASLRVLGCMIPWNVFRRLVQLCILTIIILWNGVGWLGHMCVLYHIFPWNGVEDLDICVQQGYKIFSRGWGRNVSWELSQDLGCQWLGSFRAQDIRTYGIIYRLYRISDIYIMHEKIKVYVKRQYKAAIGV